jgi:hypothetical protein
VFVWQHRGPDPAVPWRSCRGRVVVIAVHLGDDQRVQMSLAPQWGRCEVAVPGSRSSGDALRSILLIIAALAVLVAVRWSVTGDYSRPIVAPAPTAPGSTVAVSHGPPPPIQPDAGTRLSLGGRQPALVDPASGSIRRLPWTAEHPVTLFRQGPFTVLVADGRAWAVPAGQAGPRRPLGQALRALPAEARDHAWLVDSRFGPPERHYDLLEVGLVDGRRRGHLTLPYHVAPVAVLRSGVLANDLDGDLVVVEPGSGRVRTLLAHDATFLDARADRVAWLAGGLLYVRHLARGTTTVVSPPPASAGWYGAGKPVSWAGCCYGLGAFDPGGRWLAVYTHLAGPRSPGLAIVDLTGGRAALLAGSEDVTPTGGQPSLGWASNGWLFFLASGPTTTIAAWRPGDRAAGLVWLDGDRVLDTIPRALAPN